MHVTARQEQEKGLGDGWNDGEHTKTKDEASSQKAEYVKGAK